MTTVRYNPNQPARQENASVLARQIMRDAKREMLADGGELTKAERDDLMVIYNTARETAEGELGAFNDSRLSEQDALILVKGKMAASGAKFEDFQRMMGVRMQSKSSEVLARFLKKDAAAGARKALSKNSAGARDIRALTKEIQDLGPRQQQAISGVLGIDGADQNLETAFKKLLKAGNLIDAVGKIPAISDEGNREWARFKAVLLNTRERITLAIAEANTAIAAAGKTSGGEAQVAAQAPKPPQLAVAAAMTNPPPVAPLPKSGRAKDTLIAARSSGPAKAGPDVIANPDEPLPLCKFGDDDPLAGAGVDCHLPPRPLDPGLAHAARLMQGGTAAGPASAPTAIAAAAPAKSATAEAPAPAAATPARPAAAESPAPKVSESAEVVADAKPASAVSDSGARTPERCADPEFNAQLDAILGSVPNTPAAAEKSSPTVNPRVAAILAAVGSGVSETSTPPAAAPRPESPSNQAQPAGSEGPASLEGRTEGHAVGIGPARGPSVATEGPKTGPAKEVMPVYRLETENQLAEIDDANFQTFDRLRSVPPDCVIVICGDPKTDEGARKLMFRLAEEKAATRSNEQFFHVDPRRSLPPDIIRDLRSKGIVIGNGIVKFSPRGTVQKYRIPMVLNMRLSSDGLQRVISPEGEQIEDSPPVHTASR